MITYQVRKKHHRTYEVAKFEDGEYAGTYNVTHTVRDFLTCDCPGFAVQRVKEEHKHCLIAKFWQRFLAPETNYEFWMNGKDVDYRRLEVFDEL